MAKAKIYIYDSIGEGALAANDFRLALEDAESQGATEFDVHINSYGGSVFDGIAIFNLLKQRNVNTYVDGIAASIASVIAMAGKKVYMYKNTMLMIHNVWALSAGDSNDMQKSADTLAQINNLVIKTYMDKTGLSKAEVTAMMDAQTFLSDKEALKKGFIDGILDPEAQNVKEYVGFYYNVIDEDLISKKLKDKEMNKELLNFLGLPETATDTDVKNKLSALRAELKLADTATLAEILAALKPVTPTVPVPGTTDAEKIVALQTEINSMKDATLSAQASALVDSAIADGKILPADKDIFLNNAKADLAGTKAKLDAKEKNSAIPSKVKVDTTEKPKTSGELVKAAAEQFKVLRGK